VFFRQHTKTAENRGVLEKTGGEKRKNRGEKGKTGRVLNEHPLFFSVFSKTGGVFPCFFLEQGVFFPVFYKTPPVFPYNAVQKNEVKVLQQKNIVLKHCSPLLFFSYPTP
jgi:hypothetical protein